MKLDDFNFSLPEHLIAQHPCERREESRLLHVNRANASLTHQLFFELEHELKPHDLLVMNDSRTMNARLFAQKQSGGKVEILIEKVLSDNTAKAMLKCSRKPRTDDLLLLSDSIHAKLIKREEQWFYLEFNASVMQVMHELGQLPLPPYIKRPEGATQDDAARYQTVYAQKLGSVATPTAGLHFSDVLLQRLATKNVQLGYLTLHVGSGTFQPVRTENIADHTMHKELIEIDEKLCEQIHTCQQNGGRIIAVGTTSIRALESMMRKHKAVCPYQDYSDIFIYPGVKFELVQGLVTNFHLPKSTLFMLVCAFAGKDLMQRAYQEAIDESYRFFSYGDAMVIL